MENVMGVVVKEPIACEELSLVILATWRKDHQPVFKYGAFVVKGKGAKERKGKWDLVKVIGAYTGTDYLPTLASEGY